jgi:hypothetical protein
LGLRMYRACVRDAGGSFADRRGELGFKRLREP